jgi:hypothetical protein
MRRFTPRACGAQRLLCQLGLAALFAAHAFSQSSPASLPSLGGRAGDWGLMFQGSAVAQFDAQSGTRGASQAGSLSWAMLMATHALGDGQIQLRTMLSLDALGVGGSGYPLLLQSGEIYDGQPIHDRQHPHDAFMEVAARYQREIVNGLGLSLYAAPAGEPALGPVAFMMRPSAMDNPIAPIGHHWQDATHVSFGVLTAGLFTKRWTLDASWFNGREPDDQRWNFDPIRLDSYSARLSYAPDGHWSFTGSYGYLNSPEQSAPTVSEHRAVGSIAYGTAVGMGGRWSSTLIWGGNGRDGEQLSSSVLGESELSIDARNSFIVRAEYVAKSAAELVLDTSPSGFAPGRLFDVGELSLGYVRELKTWGRGTLGAGVLGTVNFVPAALQTAYGSMNPLGAVIFVRVRPRFTGMTGMDMEHMKAAAPR